MATSIQTHAVEVSAYDGVVIFSGLGREPIVLAADVAERIGYSLSAAAFAACHNVTRTWREEIFGLDAEEPVANDTRRQTLDEPRSFHAEDSEASSL